MRLLEYNVPNWALGVTAGGAGAAGAVYLLYRRATSSFNTFHKLGVPGPKPSLMSGSMNTLMKNGWVKTQVQWQKEYGDVVGYFMGHRPVMIFYDLEVIKEIAVKEFNTFINRKDMTSGDPLYDLMLTRLNDAHWKHVRTILTPTFSSGRLRKMAPLMNKSAQVLDNNLQEVATNEEVVEVRANMGAFAMDVIASTAFGIDIDSLSNPKSPFVRHANIFTGGEGVSRMRIMLFLMLPFLRPLLDKFDFSIIPHASRNFFVDIVTKAIEARKERQETGKANDLIQLMIDAHLDDFDPEKCDAYEGSKDFLRDAQGVVRSGKGLTQAEILSQGVIFFVAGYDNTANQLALLLYALACHQDAQERVYNEIFEVLDEGEEPNYDNISKMKYLEMCLEETLRVYTPIAFVDRICNKDITIKGHFIPQGMTVQIPIYSVHHNPDVYPEPEKFIPERFTKEEKAKRGPYHWIPFGIGPRICLAMRMATMEIKMGAVHLLRQYRFNICDLTEIPPTFSFFGSRPTKGIRLQIQSRSAKE